MPDFEKTNLMEIEDAVGRDEVEGRFTRSLLGSEQFGIRARRNGSLGHKASAARLAELERRPE